VIIDNHRVVNGTYYHKETSQKMASLLEAIRCRNQRVRFHWGDVETGEDWGDIYDVCGTIGRSMGPHKVPILIYNSRSTGGTPILDNCIVKIEFADKREGVIYQHPRYHVKPN